MYKYMRLALIMIAGKLGGCEPFGTDDCPAGEQKWYEDYDGDGYGRSGPPMCSAEDEVEGHSRLSGDCLDRGEDLEVGQSIEDSGLTDGYRDVNPGELERPGNGFDDDCDGEVDEVVDPSEVCDFMVDGDNDGYPANYDRVDRACGAQIGWVDVDIVLAQGREIDCNDALANVNPGRTEVCNGIDDNCVLGVDEENAQGSVAYYDDTDNDGFGEGAARRFCSEPAGYASEPGDCNDALATVNPDADELCSTTYDDDCDGAVNEPDALGTTIYYPDSDRDGWGVAQGASPFCTPPPSGWVAIRSAVDCDDSITSVNPGATEVCNGRDDDCDGTIDDGVGTTFYVDGDGDGYGDPTRTEQACAIRAGLVTNANDCDDRSDDIHPNAPEVCNGVSDDCDAQIDEGVEVTYFRDGDSDGYGDPMRTALGCPSSIPSGYVVNDDDCNDGSSAIRPGAVETCDTIDNDCDRLTDEAGATGGSTFHRDGDGDTWGHMTQTIVSCPISVPAGYVSRTGDCVDNDAAINPGAQERCNGIDEDCDGTVDDNAINRLTFFEDVDGDLFGDPNADVLACVISDGLVTDDSDCDDLNDEIYPGAQEWCNGEDDDCDNVVDEGVEIKYARDADRDTYGTPATAIFACPGSVPSGYVLDHTDCDDTRASVNPGALEACNGYDDDCDEQVDEPGATGGTAFFVDADGDTWGHMTQTTLACILPANHSVRSGDCNDQSKFVYPFAPERCNGIDDDCDEQTDESPLPSDPSTREWYQDYDRDGWGNDATAPVVYACSAEPTHPFAPNLRFTEEPGDCNDGVAGINPGMAEVAGNAIDDDCDGLIDETGSSGGTGGTGGGTTDWATYNCFSQTTYQCQILLSCTAQGGANLSVTASGPLQHYTLGSVGTVNDSSTVRYVRDGSLLLATASYGSSTRSATITNGNWGLELQGSTSTAVVHLGGAYILDSTLCRIERRGDVYRVRYVGP